MADILDRILHTLAQVAPDIPADAITATEARIRFEFGGCDGGYIAKRPALQRAVVIGQQLRQGANLAQAVQAAGVKRRQGFNLLAKPVRRPR